MGIVSLFYMWIFSSPGVLMKDCFFQNLFLAALAKLSCYIWEVHPYLYTIQLISVFFAQDPLNYSEFFHIQYDIYYLLARYGLYYVEFCSFYL